jgi:hypothetical protein
MANVKITELAAADPLTGGEDVPIVQGGSTKRASARQITAKSAYLINQASLNGAIEARPPTAQVPNGRVIWSLFNKPGAAGGPSDVQSRDIVFNISGVAWT